MKETIYTIPLNEVYEADCECPLCYLKTKLENEAVEYTLGAAMMEPDFRIESNEKGFCNKHYSMLMSMPNKLPLALVLDTHLEELRSQLDKVAKKVADKKNSRKLFKKDSQDRNLDELLSFLKDTEDSCLICDKINHTMSRYIEILFYLWKKEPNFKEKFDNSKGVCLPHLKELLFSANKELKGEDAKAFISGLLKKEISQLKRIQEDIHKFTLKFDYRNKDMEWGTAKDSPIRTVEKISGAIIKDINE